MAEIESTNIKELLRRVKLTTKARYQASYRLLNHQKWSTWTISFLSCALITIPLIQVYNIGIIDDKLLSLFQSILAILVLVYSLLLGQENFISKSEAMHRNGIELGKFARKLVGIQNEDKYINLIEEYYAILEKYENHNSTDYYFALMQTPENNASNSKNIWIRAYFITLISYSHYFIIIVGIITISIFFIYNISIASLI